MTPTWTRSMTTLVALGAALVLVALAGSPAEAGRRRPKPQPELVVTAPVHGSFSLAADVTVSGEIVNYGNYVTELTVNGVVVTPDPDGTFSTVVPLDAVAIVNPVETRLVRPGVTVPPKVDRRVVLAGDSVPDGAFSLESIALRLNDTGLDSLEPFIEGLVDIDLAELLEPGTEVISNFCYFDTIFGCVGSVDVFIDGGSPPSISGFDIDVDAQNDYAFGDITLHDLEVTAFVDEDIGVGISCYIDLSASTAAILGDYALEPDALDPSEVDVEQLGSVSVVFGGFADSTSCGGLLGGLVEALIGLVVGDLETLFDDAITDFLNMPDSFGNTPVAGAIEAALTGIEIAGPIGEGLGVVLEAPLFAVAEDTNGITLGSDTAVTADFGTGPAQCDPPPGSPDLLASFHVPEAFPVFATTSPGGFPYELGICVSTSAFNQLLKAEVECGLLRTALAEIDLGTGALPLTAGLLALFVPEFGVLDPATPMEIQLRPTLAPFLTGEEGPGGEIAELRIAQLEADVVDPATSTIWATFATDARAGLDLGFDNLTGSLVPSVGSVTPGDVDVAILSNMVGANEATLQILLPQVLALVLPSLGDSLGAFPFPSFFGLQLQAVEVGREGEFMSVFADLVEPGA